MAGPGPNEVVSGRSRSYAFTWYPNADDLKEDIRHWSDSLKGCVSEIKHARYQLEKCPETGRVHVQGCICFHSAKTFSATLLWFKRHGRAPHLERARNWNACLNYVQKSQTSIPGSQVNIETSMPESKVVSDPDKLFSPQTPVTCCVRPGCEHTPILRLANDPKCALYFEGYQCPFTGSYFT